MCFKIKILWLWLIDWLMLSAFQRITLHSHTCNNCCEISIFHFWDRLFKLVNNLLCLNVIFMWFIISFSLICLFFSFIYILSIVYIYCLGVDFDFGITQLSWLPPCVSAFFCDLWIFFLFGPCAPLPWTPSICLQSHGEPTLVCLRAPHLATSIVSPLCCPCTTEHVAPCSSVLIWPQRFTLQGKSCILGYTRHFQSLVIPLSLHSSYGLFSI